MKKSSWFKSRTQLPLNSDYALIPLSTDLFWNSVTTHTPFTEQYPTPTFAFESVLEQWFKPKHMKKFLHETYHMFTSKDISVLLLLKKEDTRLKYKLNFWRQVNSVLLSLFLCLQNQSCWHRLSSSIPAMPWHFTAFPFQSLPSAFKDTITARISFLPSHFSPTTINFLFRLAQME